MASAGNLLVGLHTTVFYSNRHLQGSANEIFAFLLANLPFKIETGRIFIDFIVSRTQLEIPGWKKPLFGHQFSRFLQKAFVYLLDPIRLSCCKCTSDGGTEHQNAAQMICLVPHDAGLLSHHGGAKSSHSHAPSTSHENDDFQLLDERYIKKHFKLPPRALYLEPFKRPLITFPISGENKHFNHYRKTKTNQQILDGILDGSEAITAPSIFPYPKTNEKKRPAAGEDEETIYILQLPDMETHCPEHDKTVRIPRFIWHSVKKSTKAEPGDRKQGGGPLNKPKPWLLSRLTDFDLLSQW